MGRSALANASRDGCGTGALFGRAGVDHGSEVGVDDLDLTAATQRDLIDMKGHEVRDRLDRDDDHSGGTDVLRKPVRVGAERV